MCRLPPFRLLAALLFTFALAAFPAPPARAAAIGVTTAADELNADGDCSLREAIRAANLNAAVDACPAGSGADTIDLPAGVYTLALAGVEDAALSGDLDITESLTITGALSTTTIIEGDALDNVLDIISGTTTLVGATVRNGLRGILNRSGSALAIVDSSISANTYNGVLNSGTLTITHSLIANNTNSGIDNSHRALISDSTIWNNQASNDLDKSGGGIDNRGIMLLSNSTVISNTALHGGGITNGGILTVTHSLISDNLAIVREFSIPHVSPGVGGGIVNEWASSRLIVENSSIIHNQAVFRAGGIDNMGTMQITNTTIADNAAIGMDGGSAWAGGIAHKGTSTMTLAGSIVRGNTATDLAGGIMMEGPVAIDGTTIISNTAGRDGGGIFNFSHVTIAHSVVSSNTSNMGGGITNALSPSRPPGTTTLVVSDTTISDNTAVRGAGIDNTGDLRMTGSAIISNTATEDGGGIYNRFPTSTLTATNTTISGNSAARDGGGIYNITGTLSLYNATVAHNSADADADGVGDGGGITLASGTVALQNSILGANADQGGQANDCAGALLSQGYNLLQNTAGCTIGGPATADIVGQPPLLGPLADNGGPTPTHALLPDSPAIDGGDEAGCHDAQGILLTTDQRGQPRPQGGACDIGAFEVVLARVYLPLIARP